MIRSVSPVEIPEKGTFAYSTLLTRETGEPLVAAELTTLTLTFYALDAAQTIINSVQDMNILNANLGTVDAMGILTITLRPADTIILVATNVTEDRIMLIQGTYAGGTKATRHEVKLRIRNLHKVT